NRRKCGAKALISPQAAKHTVNETVPRNNWFFCDLCSNPLLPTGLTQLYRWQSEGTTRSESMVRTPRACRMVARSAAPACPRVEANEPQGTWSRTVTSWCGTTASALIGIAAPVVIPITPPSASVDG